MREQCKGVKRVRVWRSHCVQQAESCESHTEVKLRVAHGKNEQSCRQILITTVVQDQPVRTWLHV